MNAARAYRRLKEVEEKKLANRLMLLKVKIENNKKKAKNGINCQNTDWRVNMMKYFNLLFLRFFSVCLDGVNQKST